MNIDPATLSAEYHRAFTAWPFITFTEKEYNLPRMMLYAIGSRETNLTNEVGDGGHGHGVFQLDDRSHTIPVGFDSDVPLQARTAASFLSELLHHFNGNIRAAMAAYNAGAGTVDYNLAHNQNVDIGTAGGDYSADTYQRMIYLNSTFPLPASQKPIQVKEVKMFVEFPDAPKNADAIYIFNGEYLFHITYDDYVAFGSPVTAKPSHANSNVYKAPIAPGQTDPRV